MEVRVSAIIIEDILWERAIVTFAYRAQENAELALRRVEDDRLLPLASETSESGVQYARLSITNAVSREPIGEGTWSFCRLNPASGYDGSDVAFAPAVLEKLPSLTRLFRYGMAGCACIVSFEACAAVEGGVGVQLEVGYYQKNANPRKRRQGLRAMEERVFALFHKLIRAISPHRGNRVLFLKENGEKPTGNLAAVRDRMRERGMGQHYRISERYRNTMGGRQSLFAWLGDIVAIAKSDYIFIDDFCPVFNFIDLGDDVTLVQVWHAGVGFKSVGYARFGRPGSPDPYHSAHRRYDYGVVGNAQLRETYAEVFGIEESALLATGIPRLDKVYAEGAREKALERLLDRYPWMSDGRIIVFAPTFRGAGQKDAYYPYDDFVDFEALYELCERTNSYFVFEMHHFIKDAPPVPEPYRSRLKDLSEEDLNDLLYAADVLVTDYSSCFYDFLPQGKPVVFYAPDKRIYELVHGVHQTIDDAAPGHVCNTFEELARALDGDLSECKAPGPAMVDRVAEKSGLAADRIIDAVLLGKHPEGVFLEEDAQARGAKAPSSH